MMRRALMFAVFCGGLSLLAGPASAQERMVVLVIDPGQARVNLDALSRAIEGALERQTVVRMSDERAPQAEGRLTIAFSNPNRWVLRYEADGNVAWVTDRIQRPGELRSRLASLSRALVASIEEGAEPPQPQDVSQPRQPQQPQAPRRGRRAWTEDIILALQDEIVDPFAELPARSRSRPVSVLWSEVVDPFEDEPTRAHAREVWSEVLDPWSVEFPR
jgi:hypothetical protein